MKIVTADITGSLIVNGVDVTNNVVSSSVFSGSIAGRVTNLEQFSSSLDATFATDASVTASILVLSQSVQVSQAALSSSYAATSGSFVITSGSYAAASASLSTRVTNTEATASTNTQASASFAAYSGSISTRLTTDETNITTLTNASSSFAAQSASLSTRLTTDETNFTNLSSSFASTSGSIAGRVTLIEGQYATTGSNIFTGTQRITQASNAISFTSTASLYTDGGLRVSKDSYVSGTAYFNNVVVYGTSSIQYITSSQVNFGTNIITVNTDTPAVRFGGLAVYDSGSTSLTGSMLWDSEKNNWIYSNPSGSSYNSAMLMNGPRNTGSLGSEQGTTACAMMIGQGGDHITSSMIYSYGNATCFYGQSYISGSGDACYSGVITSNISTAATACSTRSLVSGCIGIGGTLNPSNPLHIYTDTNSNSSAIKIQNATTCISGSVGIEFQLLTDFCDYKKAEIRAVASEQYANSIDLAFWSGGSTAAKHTERLRITSDGISCFACQICSPSFIGGTLSGTTIYGSTAVCSSVGKFTSCIDAGSGTFSGDILANGSSIFTKATSGGYQISLNAQTSPMKLRFDDLTGAAYGAISFQAGNGTGGFVDRLAIASTGVACFSNTVCAPAFVGGTISGTTGTFSGNIGVTVANTPEVLLTHSNTSKTFLMAVDGSNAFFRANSTNNILFQYAGGTNALSINGSNGAACFSSTVCAPSVLFNTVGTSALVNTNITATTCFGASSRSGFTGLTDNCNGVYFGMGADGTGISAGIGFFRESSGWNSALAFYTNCITDGVTVPRIQEKMRITSCGLVNIGTTTAYTSRLNVQATAANRPAIKAGYGGVAGNGYWILGDNYTIDESLIAIGVDYSSGGLVLGSALAPSTTTQGAFISTQAQFGGYGSAIRLNTSGEIYFYNGTQNSVIIAGCAKTASIALTIAQTGAATFACTITANGGVITSAGTNAFVDINGSTSGTLAGIRLYSDGSTKWIISHSTPSTYRFSIGTAASLTTFNEKFGIDYATGAATFANAVCATSFNSSASSTLNGLAVTCNVNSNCFTGITVINGAGGGSEISRAGIAFQAYDWVQSAIWHGRNASAAFEGALVFGTNPNTANLSVGGVCARLKIDNSGIATFACNICTGKYLSVGSQGGEDIVFLGGGSGVGATIEARYADGNPNVHLAGNGNSWLNRTYGSVGIGTCSPAYLLDVSGAARVGTLLVSNGTTTTWCVGRINDARANTWYTIYTWPSIYDGAFTLAQLGYEDNNGDGANAHAFWMTVGAAYSTGFSTSQIGGATNLCLQRSGQSLQALITGVTDRTSGAFIGYTLQTMIVAS